MNPYRLPLVGDGVEAKTVRHRVPPGLRAHDELVAQAVAKQVEGEAVVHGQVQLRVVVLGTHARKPARTQEASHKAEAGEAGRDVEEGQIA